jgi:hypothetical protein
MKNCFNTTTPDLTQVQQQEMQFNAWTFQCRRIHRIAQIWLHVISTCSPKLKKHFSCDEEVKPAVRKLFQKQNTIFKGGFKKLAQRWGKCIEVRGDFVEK